MTDFNLQTVVCSSCGTENSDSVKICLRCGTILKSDPASKEEFKEADLTREISFSLYRANTWIKLVALLLILWGLAAAFTVVGLIVAWIPILAGLALYQSASRIEKARRTGNKEDLVGCLAKLGSYFRFTSVLLLCMIVTGPFLTTEGKSPFRFQNRSPQAIVAATLRTIHLAQTTYFVSTGRYGGLDDLVGHKALDKRFAETKSVGGYVYTATLLEEGADYVVTAQPADSEAYGYYIEAEGVLRYAGGPGVIPGEPVALK